MFSPAWRGVNLGQAFKTLAKTLIMENENLRMFGMITNNWN